MTWQSLRDRKGIVVSALGITQTLAWASTYYLTAVFADPVSADLHLSRTWFYGAVSAALLLSGLLGPIAGRMIDRHGGRDVLAATNLVFAAGLVCLAFATGPVTLIAAWLVIGSDRSAPAPCTERRWTIMKKPLPKLKSDKAAEHFVATSDLTEYDLSKMRTIRFEFQPKDERVNMRLPRPLLDAVKAMAAKAGVPYQRFIRQALESAVLSRKGP